MTKPKNPPPKTVALIPIAERDKYSDVDIFKRIPKPVAEKTLNDIYGGISTDSMTSILFHSEDSKAELLLMLMLDPDNKGMPFSKLCHHAGMKLGEVLSMIREFKLAGVMISALNESPKIVKDAAFDAQAHQELCPRCDGFGHVYYQIMTDEGPETKERVCPKCQGATEVRVPGDKEARAKVLEVAGVASKKGGPSVLIQQKIGSDRGDALEQLITVSEKVMQK